MTSINDLTWPEAEQYAAAGALLAIPLGSTEQHGPHLPLSTDSDVAAALCSQLAAERTDVVVAPLIAYGASGEHAGFPGTLSIGHDALELLLVELGRSAAETFERILIVSAHGGNASTLERAVDTLRRESHDVLAWTPRWDGDAHAGLIETSLQLALDGDRVRIDLAEAGAVTPIAELMPTLQKVGIRAVSPNGVLGDPAGASAEHGRRVLSELLLDLLATVELWAGSATAAR